MKHVGEFVIYAVIGLSIAGVIYSLIWVKVWACQNLHPGASALACLVSK